MIQFIRAYWLPLAIVALFLLTAAAAFKVGHSYSDSAWGKKWAEHQLEDAQATNEYAEQQRQAEQDRTRKLEQVATHGQATIDAAIADRDADRISSDRLRDKLDKTIAELADSQGRVSSCTTAASQAATKAAGVLADVLKRADQRAGILAATADQAIERGLSCEAAYGSIL